MTNLTDAALAYAARGWHVHPLHDGSVADRAAGTPRLRGWPEKASTDPAVIKGWWQKWPDAWIGIATGPASRLLVVDLDKKAGLDGIAEWDALTTADGTDCVAKTPKGGLHLYYETDLDWPNSVSLLADGIDVRGSRGYVVAPPSPGRTWAADGAPGSIPGWLSAKLLEAHTAAPGVISHGGSHLADLLANPPGAADPGWNDWLTKVAGHYAKALRFEDAFRAQVQSTADSLDGTWERGEVEKIADSVWGREQAKEDGHAEFRTAALSGMAMRRARWLWEGRVPMGALTLLAGREGIGKSTTALDLASSVTRGALPGEYFGQPKGVAIIATEDDYEMTLIPRLVADHADLTRCYRIIREDVGEMELPVHIEQLAELIHANDIGLVILDPLLSRLSGKIDSYKDSDVRRALEPLSDVAHDTRCSIIGLIHVNKSTGSDPLNAIMGSRAFGAVSRSVLFSSADVKDEPRYAKDDTRIERPFLLGHVKCNVGPLSKTLLYSIETAPNVGIDPDDGKPIDSSRIIWHDEVDTTIQDAMESANAGPGSGKASAQGSEAGEWLKDVIGASGGQMERSAVMAANDQRDEPFGEKLLARALTKIGGRPVRTNTKPSTTIWTWPSLPSIKGDNA